MKFFDFEKKMQNYPYFTASEAKNIFFDQENILVQIDFWEKKKYIAKLKKGLYILSKIEDDVNPMTLAEKIFTPSYLSLEFALNYYGIIPDIPGTYTSITSRKTNEFNNKFGIYTYQKIKKELFCGYRTVQEKNISYNIATPEKAIFDYLYFNLNKLVANLNFWQEMRIDEDFIFNKTEINNYKKLFNNKKINKLINSLLEYQKNAR